MKNNPKLINFTTQDFMSEKELELASLRWDQVKESYYKRLKDQKGIQVDFQSISEANHFFKNSESIMTKVLDKYLKKETALF